MSELNKAAAKIMENLIKKGKTPTDDQMITVLFSMIEEIVKRIDSQGEHLEKLTDFVRDNAKENDIRNQRNRVVANAFALHGLSEMGDDNFSDMMEAAGSITKGPESDDAIQVKIIDPEGATEEIIKKMKASS